MKLSVLIPTYNYDCGELVRQLKEQLPADGEIIVGDDCSTDAVIVQSLNKISGWENCRVWHSQHNLGRAAIRNALAREAQGEWLLFIDADAEVRSEHFISDYLQATEQAPVICGGTGNFAHCPRPKARLRYDYDVSVEKRLTLPYRKEHPYDHFTTFNFMVQRALFLTILFDENCREYGHEDTLLGLQFKLRHVPILHIDNKLVHTGLEDAEVYLQKTETALRSLSQMSLEMRQHARVSALALRLQKFHLLTVFRVAFRLSKPLLRRILLGRNPSGFLLSLYKLGYYITL